MIRLKVKEMAVQKGIGQGALARNANMDVKTLKRIYRNPQRKSVPLRLIS